ncbi:ankyrin, partial [Polychaeton citri CBS 116435]
MLGIAVLTCIVELVNTRISHLQNNVSAQRRDSVLHWLCPHDYSNELEDYKTRRHPGTGQWFLQHSAFLDWVNASGCSTLSCAGEPGTGKTIMSTLIIDYLIDQEPNINNTVLYIFCNYKRRVEQTLMHFFASILRQLAFLSHGVFGAVEQLHDHHKTRNSRPSLQNLQSELEGAFKLSGSVYIIIDALDECEVGICKQLVKWIRDQMPHCKIHLLATTRDIGEIQTLFLKDPSLRIQATREDLERYSEHRMTEFTEEIQSDLRLRDNVVEGVVDAADGMFLLARLHIDSLKYQITPNDLRETLRALRGGNEAGEYGAYSAAYETAMERVESQHKRRRDLAMRIFAWIVHAKRPLRLVELQHALATRRGKNQLDPGDFVSNTTVLSVCAGLVSSDNQSSIVRLVHYTAQAFFEKAWRQWFLEETMAIAETCTVYLSFGAFAKGPCTTDDSMIRRYQEHALLRYAAQYWGDHIRVLEATQDIVSSPFKNTFMSFLNDKNLVSSATQAMPASSYSYVGEITSRICRASGIHFTARFGAVGLTALLVSHGQTVNAEDSNHQTPLVLAAWNGHEAVVRLLLDIGADVSVKSDYGTPLQTASKKGYDKIVQMLVD